MKKVNADAMRKVLMVKLMNALNADEFETLQNAGGAFSVPVVAQDGEEGYATVTVVMRDKDRDGNAYDGYADKAQYEADVLEKAVKALAREEASKAKQVAREAKDAAKAKAKADKEAAEVKA